MYVNSLSSLSLRLFPSLFSLSCVCIKLLQSGATVWTVACQALLFMVFSRQEYLSGLPCPPPGDLSDSGIEPMSPVVPALQEDSLLLRHWGGPKY